MAGGGDGLLWGLAEGHHGGPGKYVVGRHGECLHWTLGQGSDARQVRYLHFTRLDLTLNTFQWRNSVWLRISQGRADILGTFQVNLSNLQLTFS